MLASVFFNRRQGQAFRYLLLEVAARETVASTSAGFQTIDGELVSYGAGEQALRSGAAVLVGGLLVGTVLLHSDEG